MMNITVIVIETIILAILFTLAVLWGSKNPVDTVYDMPQPIIDRCLELGLIDETKKARLSGLAGADHQLDCLVKRRKAQWQQRFF